MKPFIILNLLVALGSGQYADHFGRFNSSGIIRVPFNPNMCFGNCNNFVTGTSPLTQVIPGSQSDCNPATVQQDIQQTRRDRVEPAFARGDLNGVAQVFAPDIYFVTSGSPTLRSRQEVLNLLSQLTPQLGIANLRLNREQYLCMGPYAVEIGTFQMINANGQPVITGRDMVVWRKTNGVWYQQYSFNVGDTPPPTAASSGRGGQPQTSGATNAGLSRPQIPPSPRQPAGVPAQG